MKYDMDNRPMIRLHSTKNMERFSSAVDNNDWSNMFLCSLAVLDPRVGHTMDVLSPFIPVLCHSD